MFSDSSEIVKRIKWPIHNFLLSLFKPSGQFITSFFLYLNQMANSEKSDDANAMVLSIQNVLKRCKDASKSACCAGYVRSIYADVPEYQGL